MPSSPALQGQPPDPRNREQEKYLLKKLADLRQDCQWLVGLGAAVVLAASAWDGVSLLMRKWAVALGALQILPCLLGAMSLLNDDMTEIRGTLGKIEDKVLLIIKELKLCAKKDEVQLLKKYVNLWEPINFVTRKEVEHIIESVLLEGRTGD